MLPLHGSPGVLRAAAGDVLRLAPVLACALVDVESGLLLDGEYADRARIDAEAVAAAQAEVMRAAGFLGGVVRGDPWEVVVRQGTAVLHVIRLLPDPAGPGLVLSVLVRAPERNVKKVRRALDRIPPESVVPARPPALPPPLARRVPRPDPEGAWRSGGPSPVPREPADQRTVPLQRVSPEHSEWFVPTVPGALPPPRRIVVPHER